MEIREIKEKEKWEKFILDCKEKTFLHSFCWGKFQQEMGNKIWRFGFFEKNELVSVVLVVKIKAKRGNYLLVPHGPSSPRSLLEKSQLKYEVIRLLLEELKKIAKDEKADFIRVSPIWDKTGENEEIFKKVGFQKGSTHEHPEASWKLDITPTEDELLKNMRKTTRYLIRQAEKNKDIEVFQGEELEDVEKFNELHKEVVKKQKFTPFSLDYFKKEFLAFNSECQITLFFAEYKGEIIASSYVIFWSNIGFYHHAALLPQYHKIPASYLLQWESIKEAKRRGCILYDFWGFVDPKRNPKHPWAGPTLFKMGFGGRSFEYLKTQDFPISKKYILISLFEKMRKVRRGL